MKLLTILLTLLSFNFTAQSEEHFIGISPSISTGGGMWGSQSYDEVLEVLNDFQIPEDAHWSAILNARGEIDVIFIHINGEYEALVNSRGQWQHQANLDAQAWRLHIHHAEVRASIMNPDLNLNRYMIMGGIGTKQMVFGQVTMSGSVGVMFLIYDISSEDVLNRESYSLNNAESLYAGLNLRYQSDRIDVRGKFAVFGTPQFNNDFTFIDYLRDRENTALVNGITYGYMGNLSVYVKLKNVGKFSFGPYLDLRYMQTDFQTQFFAGIGIRVQRR